MVVGIQIVGIIFGIGMLFLSYLYFRKKEFGPRDFAIWVIVWIIFLIAIMFPKTVNVLLDTLGIVSALWLFALVFHLHVSVRKGQRKLEKVVKKIALKKVK